MTSAGPAAIVLCHQVTGLATVRALGRQGVDVHAFVFDSADPLRLSRHVRSTIVEDEEDRALVDRLIERAWELGGRPVVLPTSDRGALLLARHAPLLAPVARTSTTSLAALERIVHKDKLYRAATDAGVPVVPFVYAPVNGALEAFTDAHDGPYLLKPPFEGAPGSSLRAKNLCVPDRDALIAHAHSVGLEGVIVQPRVRGGDGAIYDTYGYTDAKGRMRAFATHRRLRQFPRDLGATSFGEIPSGLGSRVDDLLFAQTERLLAAVPFHGIFGIEWVHDRARDTFSLIDFNARAFSSIGHLDDCGLNLPHLAWRELAGDDLRDVVLRPELRPSVWVNMKRDLNGWRRAGRDGARESLAEWARTVAGARSFAYWDPRDPGPFVLHMLDVRNAAGNAWRRLRSLGRR